MFQFSIWSFCANIFLLNRKYNGPARSSPYDFKKTIWKSSFWQHMQPSVSALVLCLQLSAISGLTSSSLDGGKTSKISENGTFKSCSQCQYTRWQHLCCVHMWHFLIYKGGEILSLWLIASHFFLALLSTANFLFPVRKPRASFWKKSFLCW